MTSEQRCDRETAEHEFERFTEAMRLNRRLQRQRDADTQTVLDNAKENVICCIQNGWVEITQEGKLVFRPESSPDSPITFSQPKGKTLMTADMKKERENIAKLFLQLSHMTGETTGRFQDMPTYDLDVVQDIWLLFFA